MFIFMQFHVHTIPNALATDARFMISLSYWLIYLLAIIRDMREICDLIWEM